MNQDSQAQPGARALFADKDRVVGLSLIAVSFLAGIWISWEAKLGSLPRLGTEPAPPSAEGIAGFPEKVEPLALLERAAALTPRTELAGLAISKLEKDGTVNVGAGATVRFLFRSKLGEGPEPERAYGSLARRHYCGAQSVVVNAEGIGAETDKPAIRCASAPAPTGPLVCRTDQLWATMGSKDASATSMQVEFYAAEGGPAWKLKSDTGSLLAVGADCTTELQEGTQIPKLGVE